MTIAVPAAHREVRLAARPEGTFRTDHLRVVKVPVPEYGPGEVLVRNRMMSVTAVMRTLMDGDIGLPMPAYEPGRTLWGPAIGEVIDSADADLSPGDLVV